MTPSFLGITYRRGIGRAGDDLASRLQRAEMLQNKGLELRRAGRCTLANLALVYSDCAGNVETLAALAVKPIVYEKREALDFGYYSRACSQATLAAAVRSEPVSAVCHTATQRKSLIPDASKRLEHRWRTSARMNASTPFWRASFGGANPIVSGIACRRIIRFRP